jgi:hypothetical protein
MKRVENRRSDPSDGRPRALLRPTFRTTATAPPKTFAFRRDAAGRPGTALSRDIYQPTDQRTIILRPTGPPVTGLREHKPQTAVRCAGHTERGSDAARRTNKLGSSCARTDSGGSSASREPPATSPLPRAPPGQSHRQAIPSAPQSSRMCVTPYTTQASKPCGKKC